MRPDGQEVRWDIISILTPALPFLRSPYAPPIAPDPQATRHDNGARGIARLQIESSDPATLTRLYTQLLGTAPLTGTQEHGEATVFRVGSGMLGIVESEPLASAAPRTRPPRRALRSLTLRAGAGAAARTLDPAHTHGATIHLVARDPD
ncbi:MAG: VOC family protein [Deltaproteobacteria bacterium]|nr:VOC family protein [Deltaproteobacteria bacterium]